MSHIPNRSRITETFDNLKKEGRAGLVTYVMAYDPDYQTSLDILNGLPTAGADVIELGMPFSDPMADGPAIQEAAIRALKSGAKMAGIFEMVKEFRLTNNHTPLILMGYYNMVLRYGVEAFTQKAKEVGVDGLLIVDLPPEEDDSLFTAANSANLALIKLVTPTTDAKRLQTILPKASGFLYYVSVAGVTGTKSATIDSIDNAVSLFKQHTDLPIAVGFGIKTPEQAQTIGKKAEGVVVGSALVQKAKEYKDHPEKVITETLSLVKALRKSLSG